MDFTQVFGFNFFASNEFNEYSRILCAFIKRNKVGYNVK